MKRLATVLILFIPIFSYAGPSSQGQGRFFEVQGSLSQGHTNYSNHGYNINGTSLVVGLGYRPGDWVKLGLVGVFDTFDLKDSVAFGTIKNSGYGVFMRFFFLPYIFIEGAGGNFQTFFTPAAGPEWVANGSYTQIGMGVEFSLQSWVALIVSANSRQYIYTKNEFEKTSTFQVGAGLSLYLD